MNSSLPETWGLVRIGNLVERVESRSPSDSSSEDFHYIDISSVDNTTKSVRSPSVVPVVEAPSRARQVVLPGDILVSTVRPALNAVAMVPDDLTRPIASTGFCVLRAKPALLSPKYLFHFTISDFFVSRLVNHQKGGSYPAVTDGDVLNQMIPLPPLSEQQRIVDILQEVEAVRRLRAQAEAKTAELIPALFHQAFLAHPERNKWPEMTINKVAANDDNSIRTGPFGSDLLHSEFIESGIPVLGIDNVVSNRFRWDERRYITQSKYESLSRFRVYPDDVMVTIMGTVGRCAIAPADLPEAISTKHLCVITPDKSQVLPTFLWASILSDPTIRAQTKAIGKGAIMEGWNSKIIRALKFRLPPLDFQRAFEKQVNETLALEECAGTSDTIAKSLTQSLSAHAFTGQLTADWRNRNPKKLAQESVERDRLLSSRNKVGVIPLGDSFIVDLATREADSFVVGHTLEGGLVLEQRQQEVFPDLNREQNDLLSQIKKHVHDFGGKTTTTKAIAAATGVGYRPYFTAESLSNALRGPLNGNPQRISMHLKVLATRGLIIPLSRRRKNTNDSSFAACYRLPRIGSRTKSELQESGLKHFYPEGDDVKHELMKIQRRLATGAI